MTVGAGPAPGVGDTDTINLANQPVPGTVVINKTGHGGAALGGAGFTLFVDAEPLGGSRGAEDITAAGGCTTNSSGTCSITGAALGRYWLVETTTPPGYTTVSPTAVTVDLGPSANVGDTDTVNVTNRPPSARSSSTRPARAAPPSPGPASPSTSTLPRPAAPRR